MIGRLRRSRANARRNSGALNGGPQKKGAGARPALPPYNAVQHLPLSDDRRWGFALTDVLSAARDAQESQHRGCC